jgi:hypothetical protein
VNRRALTALEVQDIPNATERGLRFLRAFALRHRLAVAVFRPAGGFRFPLRLAGSAATVYIGRAAAARCRRADGGRAKAGGGRAKAGGGRARAGGGRATG